MNVGCVHFLPSEDHINPFILTYILSPSPSPLLSPVLTLPSLSASPLTGPAGDGAGNRAGGGKKNESWRRDEKLEGNGIEGENVIE